jgi:hypothetical protein
MMPAPQHLIDIIKSFHSDACINHGPESIQAEHARTILGLLEAIPPVSVDVIVGDVLRDFVGFLIASADGFRVGGTNSENALMAAFAQYQDDRGFTVPDEPLTVEGVVASWTEVLGHSR